MERCHGSDRRGEVGETDLKGLGIDGASDIVTALNAETDSEEEKEKVEDVTEAEPKAAAKKSTAAEEACHGNVMKNFGFEGDQGVLRRFEAFRGSLSHLKSLSDQDRSR